MKISNLKDSHVYLFIYIVLWFIIDYIYYLHVLYTCIFIISLDMKYQTCTSLSKSNWPPLFINHLISELIFGL